MKFIAFVSLIVLLFLIPVCSATSFGIPTFEGTDGITYARSGYPNSSIECNDTLGYCENYKPAPLSARFYYDGRIYLGKDTDHYIGIKPVGIFYINYEDPTEKEQLIGLSSVTLSVEDNVATYSKGPVDIVFTNSFNRIKGDIIFPNTLPVPTVDNPTLCVVWEIVGHAGINTDDGEKSDWWFEQAKAFLPLGDIQNNGAKELKKKIFRQNGNVYLVEGVGYNWASSDDRTESQFIIDPTIIYNGDDAWADTSGTLLMHGDGNLRSPPNVTDGLVSFWSPGTDIGTGSQLYDIWNGNHGTIYSATWNMTSGMLEYDGNAWVDLGNSTDLQPRTNNYTIITNVITNQTLTPLEGDKVIIRKDTTESPRQFYGIDMAGYTESDLGKAKSLIYSDGTKATAKSTTLINDSIQHQLSVVRANNYLYLYVDNILENAGSESLPLSDLQGNQSLGLGTDISYNQASGRFIGSIGTTYFYNVELTNDQINETRDNYHATSAYREIAAAQDAGADQVWKYVGILGTDAGINTTGLLQINGSSDNVSFSGWQDVGAFDIDDNIVIPEGLEYRYARFRWYSNTTYQPETDIIENFVMVSPSGVFSSVWNTSLTSAGSSPATNVKLPLEASGTYSFLVDWGDNTSDIIGTWDQDEVNHTYASAGVYTINITGQIEGWRFNNCGDRLKILNITNWGNLRLGNSNGYFYGCSDLNITASDTLDLSNTITLQNAFRDCSATSLINTAGWDTTNIDSFTFSFAGCTNLTSFDMSELDTSNVTSFYYTFYGCSKLESLNVDNLNTAKVSWFHSMFELCSNLSGLDISFFDITSLIDAENMLKDVTLENSNYNSLLINWSQQSVNNDVIFHGGNSLYTEGPASTARNDTLIGIYSWTITDGGMIPEIIPPTYSDAGHNSTVAGMPVQFSLTCNDNVALETAGQYIFSTNNTGEWVNSSAVNFTSTPEIAINTTTLNATIGTTVGYMFYISDNRGNTNVTPIYTLTTTKPNGWQTLQSAMDWAKDVVGYLVTNIGVFIVTGFSLIAIIILMSLIGAALSIQNIIFR